MRNAQYRGAQSGRFTNAGAGRGTQHTWKKTGGQQGTQHTGQFAKGGQHAGLAGKGGHTGALGTGGRGAAAQRNVHNFAQAHNGALDQRHNFNGWRGGRGAYGRGAFGNWWWGSGWFGGGFWGWGWPWWQQRLLHLEHSA